MCRRTTFFRGKRQFSLEQPLYVSYASSTTLIILLTQIHFFLIPMLNAKLRSLQKGIKRNCVSAVGVKLWNNVNMNLKMCVINMAGVSEHTFCTLKTDDMVCAQVGEAFHLFILLYFASKLEEERGKGEEID